MNEWDDNRTVMQNDEEVEIEEFRPKPLPKDTRLDLEVVRVQRIDYDTEMEGSDSRHESPADGSPAEDAAREDGEADQPKPRERFRLIRQLMLGTILNNDVVRENYRYAIIFAAMLFLSIVMLFTSLGSYLKYIKLEDEVLLLRERAIRMSEERYEKSSHSAIVRQLNERGIKLADPQEPYEVLE